MERNQGNGEGDKPLSLSVIIAARDAEETLGDQLDALVRQAWEGSWEVILADNGSIDGTRVLAERYRGRLPALRIVDASERPGAGYARNVGVRYAKGDALLFCDADDVVGDGWLTAMGLALQQHGAVASCFDPIRLNDPNVVRTRGCPQQDGVQIYRYPPYLPHAGTSGLGVSRALHEAIGGFDESFYRLQDTDYCWRLQLAGAELHFARDAVVHVRYRTNGKANYKQARQWGEFNVKLYKKFRAHGMPPISLGMRARVWRRLVKRLPAACRGERREQWLWQLHWTMGRVVGSIKYRVFGL